MSICNCHLDGGTKSDGKFNKVKEVASKPSQEAGIQSVSLDIVEHHKGGLQRLVLKPS